MEALWVIVMIIVAIVNGVSKSKQKAEAAKKAQERTEAGRAAPPSPSAPQPRTRAAMVEEQRRRAEAYRQQQAQPMNRPASQQSELPPWKRSPAAQQPVSEPRPMVQTVPVPARQMKQAPPGEQAYVVVSEAAAKPLSQPRRSLSSERPPMEESSAPGSPMLSDLSGEDWRRAFVLAEALAPPKSKRGPGYKVF